MEPGDARHFTLADGLDLAADPAKGRVGTLASQCQAALKDLAEAAVQLLAAAGFNRVARLRAYDVGQPDHRTDVCSEVGRRAKVDVPARPGQVVMGKLGSARPQARHGHVKRPGPGDRGEGQPVVTAICAGVFGFTPRSDCDAIEPQGPRPAGNGRPRNADAKYQNRAPGLDARQWQRMVEKVTSCGVESCLGTELAGGRYRNINSQCVRATQSADASTDLAKDLRFAKDSRIKPGCHRGQMEHGVESPEPAIGHAAAVAPRRVGLHALAGFDQRAAGVGVRHVPPEHFSLGTRDRGQAPRAERELQ